VKVSNYHAVANDDELKALANQLANDTWIADTAAIKSNGYVSFPRRIHTIQLALAAVAMTVPGDIVETGLHTGGTATLLMKVLIEKDKNGKLFWGADSFEGLPEHGEEDTRAVDTNITLAEGLRGQAPSRKGQFRASEDQFISTLVTHKVYEPQRIKLLKGWFKDTLPSAPIEKIAFLRLDGDIYSSTRDAIEALYDRVSTGGFIYVDDYGSFLGYVSCLRVLCWFMVDCCSCKLANLFRNPCAEIPPQVPQCDRRVSVKARHHRPHA
jgi:hypothetical protein